MNAIQSVDGENSLNPVLLPLFLAAAGIVIGIAWLLVKTKEGGNPRRRSIQGPSLLQALCSSSASY